MFRDDFVWGVASSAYQVEGTDPDDGRGVCIWDTYIDKIRTPETRDASISCDHMHRYEDDFRLMKHLAIKANRFSVSWSRLIPDGTGEVNEKAVDMYRDMIIKMKENGITPYLTLYHWELPQALQDRGGWLNEEIVEWFGYYAKVVAERFSDLVEYYFTLNEPQCFVGIGHHEGWHAPGLKLSMKEVFQVAHNALKAHGTAVKALRKYSCRSIKIGYAPTCGVAYPYTNTPEDIEAAKKVYFGFYMPDRKWTWNVSWFSDPVFLGHYPEEGIERFKEYLPIITDEDMKLINQPLDFMGQNIYNGYCVRAGKDGTPEYVDRVTGFPFTGSKWPVTPECLYWGIRFIYERYKMPIYITENGTSEPDRVSSDGLVHDVYRREFLDRYISELQRAVDEGADVRGYFLWTFLDNFEWDKFYNEKFGIVYVDFASQKRIVKDSAYWYRDMICCNGANLLINNTARPVIFLKPELKKRIWGGNRLVTEYGCESDMTSEIGECWGVSAYEGADCVIDGGIYDKRTLSDLYANEHSLFGNITNPEFPLLTKILDAKSDLSIQVHPDDEYAMKHDNSKGKNECWYILDCPENATLILGNKATDRENLIEMVDKGEWDKICNEISVKAGDFVQLNSGTLHAIKAGFVILETQQASDLTYRIYDYDRESNGVKRELHHDKGLAVINVPDRYDDSNIIHTTDEPGVKQLLVDNRFYKVSKLCVKGEMDLTHNENFMIGSVVEGDGIVAGRYVKKGTHFIIPYKCEKCIVTGEMTLILSSL